MRRRKHPKPRRDPPDLNTVKALLNSLEKLTEKDYNRRD